jgi:hypothetical protein
VGKILVENLGMRNVSAEIVPQILSDDGNGGSLILVFIPQHLTERNNILCRVFMGDELF